MAETPIPGIPTLYHGRQYRSRLEARWACFFDLLGWRYEYEPCDFEGWIPDFVLLGERAVYVEVKPVTAFPEDVAAKIDATSCAEEALIVGMTLPMDGEFVRDEPCLGWLRDGCNKTPDGHPEYEGGWCWAAAPFGVWQGSRVNTTAPRQLGFCHEYQSYRDRMTGRYDGGCHGQGILDRAHLFRLWAEAGNQVQWIARTTLKTQLSTHLSFRLRDTL